MHKRVLTITITGDAGIGKSAIANQVSNVLSSMGFDVQMIGRTAVRSSEELEVATKSIVQTTRIQINEVKPRRRSDDAPS